MQHLQSNTTLQGGKYRIERVLGQGGFGITYKAVQISLKRYVAIKELFIGGSGFAINNRNGNMVIVTNAANQASFDQQKDKFKKEASRLANLNHPNLVKVHELFEENGTVYYVMDYIDGESLRTKLNRDGKLSEALILRYMQQILPALDVAHKKNIWHLDIKPENIMVDQGDHVYLIDFGASKHIEQDKSLTTSLALAYTPGYCPPELTDLIYESQEGIIEALKEIGSWTDIYALGATIYNLLTNSNPPSSKRIDRNGISAFTFTDDISSSMRDMIVWMMEPRKEDRPKDANELEKRLKVEQDTNGKVIEKNYKKSQSTILVSPPNPIETDNYPQNDEEEKTILVISKTNQEETLYQTSPDQSLQRAIKVGDFIFEDGTYSNKLEEKKKPIGVLFSYYGGAHGQLLSATKPDERMSINGKELKWHKASIAEWVNIIQNLGHCKVNFSSWEYRFFSPNIHSILSNYQINEARYVTRKSISGVAYIVNLESCRLTTIDDDNTTLSYIYISEF